MEAFTVVALLFSTHAVQGLWVGSESQQVGTVGQPQTGICPLRYSHCIRKCLNETVKGFTLTPLEFSGSVFLLLLDSNYFN
jgi:hypothetical protein